MKHSLIALICGVLFGYGLALSKMINPEVVIAFLDVTGEWDPSLLFVMAGALFVSIVSFPLILKKQHPVCADKFDIPSKKNLDAPLILGAGLFGIGWGLAGICPGPAIASLALLVPQAVVFACSMIAGMGVFMLWDKKKSVSNSSVK